MTLIPFYIIRLGGQEVLLHIEDYQSEEVADFDYIQSITVLDVSGKEITKIIIWESMCGEEVLIYLDFVSGKNYQEPGLGGFKPLV